jgi:DNA-binding NarL/FixJ family response regulator
MEPVRVLLVDDNPTFLRIATRFLEQDRGCPIVVVGTAGGGQEALAQAERLSPHVILLDLMMPGTNGLEIIPRLRAVLPKVGIIALTLLDTSSYRTAALAVKTDLFVAKSAMSTDLLPAIQRVMLARPKADAVGM